MGDWEDIVARDVRANVPRIIAQEVLEGQVEDFDGADNIKIGTPNYPMWLKRIDPKKQVPLKASVQNFRRWRTK